MHDRVEDRQHQPDQAEHPRRPARRSPAAGQSGEVGGRRAEQAPPAALDAAILAAARAAVDTPPADAVASPEAPRTQRTRPRWPAVFGIAGVIGSGREELSRVLFGAEPSSSGSILVDGKPVKFASPVDAVSSGFGYIPAERRIEGIADGLSVAENIFLVAPQTAAWGPFRNPRKALEIAGAWIKRLRIRTPDERANVGNLSGGNQQKVVLAKWLNSPELEVLILDHPTRGLDVGAKQDVYALVRDLCEQGVAVLLTADTLEETIGLSHTILVMRDGKITERFQAVPGHKPQQVDLIQHMV